MERHRRVDKLLWHRLLDFSDALLDAAWPIQIPKLFLEGT